MTDKYAITGANGFVGNFLLKYFQKKGKVLSISRTPQTLANSEHEQLVADIRFPIPDKKNFSGAIVLHTAAVMNAVERKILWDTNVIGTYAVLDWAQRHEVKHVVLFSTGGVYPYAKNHLWNEESPLDPIGFYGYTKMLAEITCKAFYYHHGIPITIFRLFFPFGSGQKRGIFPLIESCIQTGKVLTVHECGAPRINPVHLADIASAVDLALLQGNGYRVFNLCGDIIYSFEDLIRLYEAKYNLRAVIHRSGQPHGDLLGSNQRLKAIGWIPSKQLDKYIEQCNFETMSA